MVTNANTKKDILDEYNRLLSEKETRRSTAPEQKTESVPVSETNQKPSKAENKKRLLYDIPLSGEIESGGNTRQEESVDELSYLNSEIIEKIKALETAKKLKRQEYEAVLAVESELSEFVKMINHNKSDILEQQSVQSSKREELDRELTEKAGDSIR